MKNFTYRLTCILFVAALIFGGTSSASAKSFSEKTSTTYIDDQAAAWNYSNAWTSTSATLAYKGKTHKSKNINNSASIVIEGSNFSLLYTKAADKGKIAVFVDNKRIITLNQRNERTIYKSVWNSPILTAGQHRVKIVHISGSVVDIDAIKVTKTVATNHFVDGTSGSDTNPGTQEMPWKTIQKAADSGTEIINVLAGTYPERVNVQRPNLTFNALGIVSMMGFTISADNIRVNNFDISTTTSSQPDGMGIYVSANGCLLENNYIHDTVRDGILLNKLSDNCIVRNNKIQHASQSGMEVHGTNHLIEKNEILDTIQYPANWENPPSWVDADGIRFFGSGHVFRGNNIHDIEFKLPENIDPHVDCFQTWGGMDVELAHDISFERNTCLLPDSGNGGGTTKGFQIDGGAYNLNITNNTVHAKLIAIVNSKTAQTHDITFLHNTFVGYPQDPYSWGIDIMSTNFITTNIRIENNIFAYQENGLGSFLVRNPSTEIQAGFNCIFRATGKPWHPANTGDVWNKDPMFVNYAMNDFRLQSNSPCMDAGKDVNINIDHDGTARKQGIGFDMGAFEMFK